LALLATVLFFGDGVYQLSNCPGLGDEGCGPNSRTSSTANPNVVTGLYAASAVGGALGVGFLICGFSQQPDEGGPQERRSLADEYNARTVKADAPGVDGGSTSAASASARLSALSANARLRTLRAVPIAADRTRGLALGISF
jgi:hypothetical protein